MLNASLSGQGLVHALDSGNGLLRQPLFGTIQGRVTSDATGRGVNHVRVELIDADGRVAQSIFTHAGGQYRFRIRQNGPYVVHLVAPQRFVQTSPTFISAKPEGTFAINPATGKPFTNASWNYRTGNSDPANGPVGPPFWSTIAPAGNLPFESPINITGAPVDLSRVLSVNYNNAVPKAIVNNGAQIQVQFPSNGADTITLGGQVYNLAQFHYHDPSENVVNGQAFPMEEHFVNISSSGAETVLAVFLQLGAHNDALDPILNAAMTSLTSPGSTTIPNQINFAGLLPQNMMGWFYQGSLTTPPLSQPLNWLVFSTPITLDFQQLKEYEQVAAGSGFLPNARPLQPLDGRRLNEIDYDVNFQGQPVTGLNFSLSPAFQPFTSAGHRAGGTTTIAAAASTTTAIEPAGKSAHIQAQALPVLQNNPAVAAAAAAQNNLPVAGCNCPLCQMLRNAIWHQVNVSALPPVVSTPAAANAGASSSLL